MKLGVVACESLQLEVDHLVQNDPDVVFVEYLSYKLRERPNDLKEEVKIHVNNLFGKVNTVFLGYAWCRSLKGITSELNVPTVMIETDDCISALLTPSIYLDERQKCAGTYYATPYLSRNDILERYYDKFASEVDEELLADIGLDWFVKQYFDGYKRCLHIRLGIEDQSTCESNSKKFANCFGWSYEIINGRLDILADSFRKAKDLATHLEKAH